MKYTCDQCEKSTDKIFTINDEGFCEDCFNDAISRAEYLWESAKEEGRL